MRIKIGIMNCVTGKVLIEKTVEQEVALEEAEKISRWFDKQDTFFSSSRTTWKRWKSLGGLSKFEMLVDGSSYNDLAVTSIAVFKKNSPRGEEHEFYMKRSK